MKRASLAVLTPKERERDEDEKFILPNLSNRATILAIDGSPVIEKQNTSSDSEKSRRHPRLSSRGARNNFILHHTVFTVPGLNGLSSIRCTLVTVVLIHVSTRRSVGYQEITVGSNDLNARSRSQAGNNWKPAREGPSADVM